MTLLLFPSAQCTKTALPLVSLPSIISHTGSNIERRSSWGSSSFLIWTCEIRAFRYASRVSQDRLACLIDRTKDIPLIWSFSMFSAAFNLWKCWSFFGLEPSCRRGGQTRRGTVEVESLAFVDSWFASLFPPLPGRAHDYCFATFDPDIF